jgi:hypothetical protein
MAVEKIVNIKVKDNADKSAKNFKNLNKEIKQTETTTKDTSKATEDVGRTTDTVTGGMVGKFKGLLTSVRGVISSFGLLKTAIIATGLGALLIAIVSIKQAFTSSEEGQNRWAKVMGVVGAIVGNFVDLLSDLGDLLIWVFTHPKEAIMSFTKALKENIINRFTGLLELIPALGKAVSKLFSGDFKEAGKIAANAVGKVALGVENVTEKINDATEATKAFIEEQIREAEIASKIADQRAKADKQERALITERALADRDIADLRAKAEERDIYNVSQRIKFLKDANDLEESITKKEIETAKLRRDAIIEENKLTKSNKEALQAEEEAKAKVIQLETSYLRAKKRLTTQIQTLTREEAAARKAANDAEVAANKEKNDKILEAEKKRSEELQKLAEKESEDLKKILAAEDDFLQSDIEKELQANYDKYAELIALATKYGQDTSVLLEAQLSNENDIKERFRQRDKDNELANAKSVADAKKAIQDSQISNVEAGINLLSQLAGENRELQALSIAAENAVGIAKIIINTQAANAAAKLKYAAIPGGLALAAAEITANKVSAGIGIAASAAAAAKGIATLRKSVPIDRGGNLGGNDSTPNANEQLSTPNFNVVGATGISQTEELQPVKAYVVSGEVTTAQSLDRNRVQNATF